jgi:hypothetical protein
MLRRSVLFADTTPNQADASPALTPCLSIPKIAIQSSRATYDRPNHLALPHRRETRCDSRQISPALLGQEVLSYSMSVARLSKPGLR